ncbi:MAG: anthranilate phosphoribosyltransferase [Verrucomicrobiales bacterium]
MLTDLTSTVIEGKALDQAAVRRASAALLDESQPAHAKTDFLRALARKGETAEEIAAFVGEFLKRAVKPPLDISTLDRPAIDVCGTGGDKLGLFNISTTSMFILAACQVAVVKHGNRGITSASGSADVLEALGVRIDLPPAAFAECVKRTGLGFMLAPNYHPAFKAVAPLRKILAAEGSRTVFNIMGPLLNPVQPPFQLAGVFEPALVRTYGQIFLQLGRIRAWAVHGTTSDGEGMDEMSTLGPSHIAKIEHGRLVEETVPRPARFGDGSLNQLAGGGPQVNAEIVDGIMRSEVQGPKRDIAILNAGAALVVAGVAEHLEAGCAQADEALASGAAASTLDRWRGFSAF